MKTISIIKEIGWSLIFLFFLYLIWTSVMKEDK